MENLLTVPKAVIAATIFVVQNAGACFMRGLPIVVAMGVLAYINTLTSGAFAIAAQVIESFLYAIFAVAWHRYSLLPEVREKRGFALAFGLREIKFGALIVVVSLASMLIASLLAAVLPDEAAVVVILILALIASSVLVFFYPAIALDQPIDGGRFVQEGLTLIFSFIIGGILAIMIFILPLGVAALVAFGIASMFGAVTMIAIIVGLVNFIASVIIIAILVSTASFLYRDVIGLRGVPGT
ncbi:hypothetical protein J0X12_08085 [Sneathiella sp. CAU 1612]|uniref:Glycerophosphoryl diester phosphodiesterase membrane domain-containing protein n=1 Tax=Sneathiella sedimenti TaxID=2816034 RepID=A0ABS3F6I5_9PROT|nr:hypothetical protein [Sneathiella sedimenti]MBO0333567.1 hypothetical protein [Sneathiella sedimenti]